MNPEEKRLLQENLALSRETNELLKKMISAQRWVRAFRIVYWLLIIGGAVGVYYWLEPLISPILGNYSSIMKSLDKIQETSQSLPDAAYINSFFGNLKKGQ